MKLTDREIAIVLAALRLAQVGGIEGIDHMPQMDQEAEAVTQIEIDDLCEKVNT